jgi:NADH-quinone oxidoreductase subunit H
MSLESIGWPDFSLGWQGLVVLVVFGISLLIATYCTYAERVIAAFLQDRVGPDRAGPYGLAQPLADAVKLFTKEEFFPAGANKALFIFGPCLAMITALMSSAVIPFGSFLKFGTTVVHLQGIEINVGMLYVFGIVSLGVYGTDCSIDDVGLFIATRYHAATVSAR